MATPSGGGGTGLVLGTPTLLSGVITAISATYSASAAGKVYVTDNNGTGSGFVGRLHGRHTGDVRTGHLADRIRRLGL